MELTQIIENLKKEQEEMQQKDALLQAMFTNAVDGIITVNERGSILSANESFSRLSGISHDLISQYNFSSLFTDSEHVALNVEAMAQASGTVSEWQLQQDADTSIPVSVSIAPISENGQKQYSIFIRDLSSEKKYLDHLEEREKLLESVIETAADGVIMIDANGKIRTFNTACERLFGYKRSEVIGNRVNMLMPEEHAKSHDGHVKRYLDTGERHIVGRGREVPGLRKDGVVFPMYLSVSETEVGGIKVFTGIIRDMTQQREQEKMLVEETIKRARAEEANFSLDQSVKYAKRIQQSILPVAADLYEKVNSFVYFKPKEVVSGDFYWMMEKGNHLFIAVVDCTGHGVPGAFMSMLGYTHLNYVTNNSRSNDPAKILGQLDQRIAKSLSQRNADGEVLSDDSMDVALVRLDLTTNELVFAGAKRPITILKNGEIENIKGTKATIGGSHKANVDFESHTIQLSSGDSFYLYSDGLSDQFNEDGDKYSIKQFYDFVKENQDRSMKELGDRLELDLYRWRGREDPIDDLTVLGVRI